MLQDPKHMHILPVQRRGKTERKPRPTTWCVPTSTALNSSLANNIDEVSKQALRHGDRYQGGNQAVNHEFTFKKLNYNCSSLSRGVTENRNADQQGCPSSNTYKSSAKNVDNNNNLRNENDTEKKTTVIRRNTVDKFSRRAIVSLNLSNDYTPYEQCPLYRTKRTRPKSVYHNIFRRSCNFVKSRVLGDNSDSKHAHSAESSPQESIKHPNETAEVTNGDDFTGFHKYEKIITDGESCILSTDTTTTNGICLPKHNNTLKREASYYTSLDKHKKTGKEVKVTSAENSTHATRLNGSVRRFTSTSLKRSERDSGIEAEASVGKYMPWERRLDSIKRNGGSMPYEPFQCRRDNRKYSSLRHPPKSKESHVKEGGNSIKYSRCVSENSSSNQSEVSSLKRHNSSENLRFTRSASARYDRPNSCDSALRRRTYNFTRPERVVTDNCESKTLNTKAMKNKKCKDRNAPNFFIRYQDILREEQIVSPISCYDDSSKFTKINEVFEYLLNMHCKKPVNKTCKQLFYIRSRLSKNARLNDSMCDGCFGCDREY